MRGCGEASSRTPPPPLPKPVPASDPGNFEARHCGTARSAMHANTPGGRISTNAQPRTHIRTRAHTVHYTVRALAVLELQTHRRLVTAAEKKGGFELS